MVQGLDAPLHLDIRAFGQDILAKVIGHRRERGHGDTLPRWTEGCPQFGSLIQVRRSRRNPRIVGPQCPGFANNAQPRLRILSPIASYARCDRYRVPNDYRALAVMVARYREHCHRPWNVRPGTVLETLQCLDALRRSERLGLFLLACEADARGRAGLAERPYPQAALPTRVTGQAVGSLPPDGQCFIQLPIDFSHLCQVETLPWHHRDPFDRLLIAQAQLQHLALVSADARFDRYGIRRIW
jgi:hypothetical protein